MYFYYLLHPRAHPESFRRPDQDLQPLLLFYFNEPGAAPGILPVCFRNSKGCLEEDGKIVKSKTSDVYRVPFTVLLPR